MNMLSRARVGTFATFALAGLLCGVWVARMPGLSAKLGIGPGAVGGALLAWGIAAIVAMRALRDVIARTGSRAVLRIAAPLTAVTAALVALAPTYHLLLIALALFGMAFGVTDVAMNAQASVVERAYDRPLMSGMHAGWCVGAMSGGLLGSLTAFLGMSFTQAVLTGAVVALPATLAVGRTYIADLTADPAAAAERNPRLPVVVYLVGALALLAFMAEGAIADWSGLLLRDELAAPEAVAALGYPLFELAMLCGRLVGDRLRTWLGTRRLLTLAGLGTALAMAFALSARSTPVALSGFFLTGLMVATIVPTMVSLSGTVAPGRAEESIAQVGTMGYGGLLLGPVVIGFLGDHGSLRIALTVVIALSVMVSIGVRLLPITAATDLATHAGRPTGPSTDPTPTSDVEPVTDPELVAA
jgi:MFS family permease